LRLPVELTEDLDESVRSEHSRLWILAEQARRDSHGRR
jgi:hypothetical protein